jgi:hypothetical protein
MAKEAFHKKQIFITSKSDLNWRKKLVKCYIWSIVCMVLKPEYFRMCFRITGKFLNVMLEKDGGDHLDWSWEKWSSIKWSEEGKKHSKFNTTKAKWTGYVSRRNGLMKLVTEGKIEQTGRWGRRRQHLLDELKETRRYCYLQDEALDRAAWRTHFWRGYRPVLRQNTWW